MNLLENPLETMDTCCLDRYKWKKIRSHNNIQIHELVPRTKHASLPTNSNLIPGKLKNSRAEESKIFISRFDKPRPIDDSLESSFLRIPPTKKKKEEERANANGTNGTKSKQRGRSRSRPLINRRVTSRDGGKKKLLLLRAEADREREKNCPTD